MGLLILALLLGWPTHKLIGYLFPLSVVLIGAGKDRDKKREIWRQISLVSISDRHVRRPAI